MGRRRHSNRNREKNKYKKPPRTFEYLQTYVKTLALPELKITLAPKEEINLTCPNILVK